MVGERPTDWVLFLLVAWRSNGGFARGVSLLLSGSETDDGRSWADEGATAGTSWSEAQLPRRRKVGHVGIAASAGRSRMSVQVQYTEGVYGLDVTQHPCFPFNI